MNSKLVPENEMGVIALFAMACEAYGWTIDRIGIRFPDVTVRHISTGLSYDAEFEYLASHFKDHGHDPRYCDLIICWINDFPECALPILSLQNWDKFRMFSISETDKELMHLRLENERLKREIKNAKKHTALPIANAKSAKKRKLYQFSAPPGNGWRIEITGRGKYFHWRRGSGKSRESVYGGKVSLLPADILTNYYRRNNGKS